MPRFAAARRMHRRPTHQEGSDDREDSCGCREKEDLGCRVAVGDAHDLAHHTRLLTSVGDSATCAGQAGCGEAARHLILDLPCQYRAEHGDTVRAAH
ncbi:hypothetical protein [Streptomyces sp. GESEQ-4]|uniref:hypothetical protein n=1 Tax=Streptomyces sp. GESEQ-4 TaxID=2812655 RepID=UPI001B32660E|nr:hypothetical protein [Streptomyces sp. GESEQ-4]